MDNGRKTDESQAAIKKDLTTKEKIICVGLSIISGILAVLVFIQLRNTTVAVLSLIGVRFLTWQAIEMVVVILGGMICFIFLIVVYEMYQHAFKRGRAWRQILSINAVLVACLLIELILIIL